MNHVMIDLETRGQTPGCAIISIGAVAFGPTAGLLGRERYLVIHPKTCHAAGLVDDPSTMTWWSTQPEEARKVLHEAETQGLDLGDALDELTSWLGQFSLPQLKVWGNGSDFDNAIMACCYRAVGKKVPWNFWNNRCYRTIKSMHPAIKLVRKGTHHNALDDARDQANHLLNIVKVTKIALM